mmetsp:Transcript_17295/g.28918  ORF Transcript_17295/g.28918 Transcript_17295/m.28918 type:complete len:211 (-) Transcript_17295:87-719(-)
MTEFLTGPSRGEMGVHAFLDSLHNFASKAKFEEYFNLFHEDGQFMGTDGAENWTKHEFKDWARPYFTGVDCAWEYIPVPGRRTVTITSPPDSSAGDSANNASPPSYAIFDEVLYCCDLKCHTRGSGTLVFCEGRWQLLLYHITFPIPDDVNQAIMSRLVKGKGIVQQKAELRIEEQKAAAAAQKLLEELSMEEEQAAVVTTKKKNTKKKK